MGDPAPVAQLRAGPTALRRAGRIWFLAALGAGVVANLAGFPAEAGGDTLPSEVEDPLRVGLLVLAAGGGLLVRRYEAAGAVVMGAAAAALGLLLAFEHSGRLSAAVSVVFAGPAVCHGLAWTWRRSRRAVVTLAAVMGAVLFVEVVAAQGLWAYHFGPLHPASPATPMAVDGVEWMWSGNVTSHQATVVARLAAGGTRARLLMEDAAGTPLASEAVDVDGERIARLRADGLAAGTSYR
ncbi:MAG: hypothetical protein ACRDYV_10180, partial [Acidimicrobiia bacterium]